MRRRYGIDLEEYEALLVSQNNLCAICSVPNPTHIDHDHQGKGDKHKEGEKVRGILCTACNNGLGLFRDNPEFLRSAADYIERSQ